jgi:hypothetical protein
MLSRSTVAIPSGAVFPDGLAPTEANPVVQRSVRPEGTYFVKSVGYETIRPGRSRFQHNKGRGIHFTVLRMAENIATPQTLPVMVDITTAPDHVDIADLPGTADLTVDGELSDQEKRILLSESTSMAPVGGAVRHRGTKTLPDMGDREPHRPLSQIFHGFSNPVEMFQNEYAQNPLLAVGAAGVVIGVVYMVARDFERSYRGRERSARRGGGLVTEAAPVAAAPAAAAETSGNVTVKAADAATAVVETAADAVETVVETAAEAVETVTETAADAVTS